MRVSVTLDDELLAEAKGLTEIDNTRQLIRRAVTKNGTLRGFEIRCELSRNDARSKVSPETPIVGGMCKMGGW